MKIAIVNDHFSSGPGGQHRIQNLATGLSRLNNEISYVSPQGVTKNFLNQKGSSGNIQSNYVTSYFKDFFIIYKQLFRANAKIDHLIVELPNTMSKSLNGFYGAAKNIHTSFDFGGLWTSFFDKGKIYNETPIQLKLARPLSQLFEDSLALFSSIFPDLVTVPTSGMLTLLKKFLRRQPHLVYQPVDTTFIFNPSLITCSTRSILPHSGYENPRFVALGVKGDQWFVPVLEDLIKECKEENLVFLVIGKFPIAEDLCIKKNLTGHVYFTGNIPYHLLPPLISIVDFAVILTNPNLTSLWYAPHNIAKIADYMAMGKPIVTDTLAASDYVENGKTGFLLEDFPNLVDKTICLLNDNDLIKKMGRNARDFSCENFDNIKVATNFLRLIRQS